MDFLNKFVSLCEFLEKIFLKHVFLFLDVFSQQTFTTIWKPKNWRERKKNHIVSKVYYVVLHIILLFPCNFCLLFVFNLMLRNTKLYV
jgi:hypothetical protein